jgi:hydrogenase nickel incorporation protein HypA/HybF
MHELSLAADIFETVREYVPLCRARSARAIRVRVGDVAGVVADSLDFCFGALVAGTPYQACYLDIERVPARGECADCAQGFTLEWPGLICPACGSLAITRLGGTDLQVVDIELDDGMEARS